MKALKTLIETDMLTFEQKTDLLLSVIEHIDMGYKIPVSLAGFAVRDNGNVVFVDGDDDISLASPEFFVTCDVPERDRSWFTLGLLAYYIFRGKSYYDEKGISPASISALSSSASGCLIEEKLFGDMLGMLTSWNASEREKGVAEFLICLRRNYVSHLRVDFLCGGELVRSEAMSINGVLMSYPQVDIITGDDGRQYSVDNKIFIPFRLMRKKYRINVSPVVPEKEKPVSSASLLFGIEELVSARQEEARKERKEEKREDLNKQINHQLEFIP